MSHHRHLVQRRLSVEDDVISIVHVSLDLPTIHDFEGSGVRHISQIDAAAVFTHDVLCPRPSTGTVRHELLDPVDVVRCHSLGEGEIQGHGSRNEHLLRVCVRVSANDAPRAEIHTLTHEVPSQTPLFGLQPGTDRVERSLGFGDRLRNPDDGIVAEGVNVVLQELAELADDVFASSCFNLGMQHLVGLDDVHKLGGAVILRSLSAKGDRRSHVWRRDRHVSDDQVLRVVLL
mmetsp:Transcript_62514/g.165895  ORF Transcript_62514/g.165895 Transcript_62514/m.165895 type:complete len:232 (-) Transcript_62514:826-1521(-)